MIGACAKTARLDDPNTKIFYQEYFSAMQINRQLHSARWHITESNEVRSSENIDSCRLQVLLRLYVRQIFVLYL